MNQLTNERRTQVIKCLCEGLGIRATVRMTGVAKNTIVKLLAEVGEACSKYQDKTLRNLSCKKIQCDEIWSFCYAKDKNVPHDKRGQFGFGDAALYAAHKRIQQKSREPYRGFVSLLHVLQLLPRSPNVACNSRDGSGN